MEIKRLQYFKSKLLSEKKKIKDAIISNSELDNEFSSELSLNDNHPSDTATELFDKEKGLALRNNELSIINKIETSLSDIEKGNYGNCKKCGVEISEERLEFIPYAEYCIECQKEMADIKPRIRNEYPISYYENNFGNEENIYDGLKSGNRGTFITGDFGDEEDTDEDPIEMISNQQYRSQLPD